MIFAVSEKLWAEHGLTGLVLFALFALIGLFIKVLTQKDHQLKSIIDDERGERERNSERNTQAQQKLAAAIEGLTKEIQNNNSK